MRRSKLQEALEAGEVVAGKFAPAGADFETPALLRWSPEVGATLELVDLSNDWPNDFSASFTIHGQPNEREAVTLMHA